MTFSCESYLNFTEEYQIVQEGLIQNIKMGLIKIFTKLVNFLSDKVRKMKDHKIKATLLSLLSKAKAGLAKSKTLNATDKETAEKLQKEAEELENEVHRIKFPKQYAEMENLKGKNKRLEDDNRNYSERLESAHKSRNEMENYYQTQNKNLAKAMKIERDINEKEKDSLNSKISELEKNGLESHRKRIKELEDENSSYKVENERRNKDDLNQIREKVKAENEKTLKDAEYVIQAAEKLNGNIKNLYKATLTKMTRLGYNKEQIKKKTYWIPTECDRQVDAIKKEYQNLKKLINDGHEKSGWSYQKAIKNMKEHLDGIKDDLNKIKNFASEVDSENEQDVRSNQNMNNEISSYAKKYLKQNPIPQMLETDYTGIKKILSTKYPKLSTNEIYKLQSRYAKYIDLLNIGARGSYSGTVAEFKTEIRELQLDINKIIR